MRLALGFGLITFFIGTSYLMGCVISLNTGTAYEQIKTGVGLWMLFYWCVKFRRRQPNDNYLN